MLIKTREKNLDFLQFLPLLDSPNAVVVVMLSVVQGAPEGGLVGGFHGGGGSGLVGGGHLGGGGGGLIGGHHGGGGGLVGGIHGGGGGGGGLVGGHHGGEGGYGGHADYGYKPPHYSYKEN